MPEERGIEPLVVQTTIFSRYLALPIATPPFIVSPNRKINDSNV
jgi:hypothetical protein